MYWRQKGIRQLGEGNILISELVKFVHVESKLELLLIINNAT